MKHAKTLGLAGLLLAGTATQGASVAYAQGGIPNCVDLPNPVFMAGTTAVIPVIRLLGARLKKVGVTLLWNENSDGCGSENLLINPGAYGGTTRTVFSNYTEDPSQPGKVIVSTCNAGINKIPDLAINDVSFLSCSGYSGIVQTLPPGFAEFEGPVQGLVPIVPIGNDYVNDASVEELRSLYQCGTKPQIMSFSSDKTIWDYNCSASGMRELWARGIGAGYGANLSTSIGEGCGNSITAESMITGYVAPSTTPLATIGYTSTEYYDQFRNRVKGVKVRGVNQTLAYLPDSDGASTDKLNIREGRYTIQNSLKLVAPVDANGVPKLQAVKNFIDWFQDNAGQVPLPFDVNEIYALQGVVPQCAMRVSKQSDLPAFKRFRHPRPCHCSFQMLATGKTSIPGCVACGGVDGGPGCPSGQVCSRGYCETP